MEAFTPPPCLGTSLSLGPWGTLLPTCTPEVFSRTCRECHSVWNRMFPVTALPMSSLKLSSCTPFSAWWPPVSAAGEVELTIN